MSRVLESGAPLAFWEPEPASRSTVLAYRQHSVELPLQRLQTLEELEKEWATILPQSRDERLRRARNLREGYVDLENRPEAVDHPFWVAQIGDALLVAHPGEAYNSFQTELRRRLSENPVLVLNVSNGGGSVYLPDARAYEHNSYTSWQTVLASGALEELTEAAAQALSELRHTVTAPA